MSHISLSNFDRIFNIISVYSNQRFTGGIELKLPSQPTVTIYLNLGYLAWVSDGVSSSRRWKRYLTQNQLSLKTIAEIICHKEESAEKGNCWEYNHLVTLAQKKILTQSQVQNIISTMAQEILFDLVQNSQTPSPQNQSLPLGVKTLEGMRPSGDQLLPHTWLSSIESVAKETRTTYEKWLKLELNNSSPNLAPVIKDHARLAADISSETYKNLVNLFNGKDTLREIAVKMKRDLITITQPLLPYLKQGIIALEFPSQSVSKSIKKHSLQTHLNVIAIDDSPQTLRILQEIVTQEKHNFIGINHPLEALPTLIEKRPDLIFIDLVMPTLSGYELCEKIRQIQAIKDIPIIMIASKNNIIGQTRAKLAGATQFITKPIVIQTVRDILNTYFQKKTYLESSLSSNRTLVSAS